MLLKIGNSDIGNKVCFIKKAVLKLGTQSSSGQQNHEKVETLFAPKGKNLGGVFEGIG
jgi:hypothetical protein